MSPGRIPAVFLSVALVLVRPAGSAQFPSVADARRLHDRAIVIDTHADTTQRWMFDPAFDISVRHADGAVDLPRMRDGGLDALFFSVWMPGTITGRTAVTRALAQIEKVREAARKHSTEMLLATTAADIRRAAAEHKVAALVGVEGGHMINGDLAVLRRFAELGMRYLTLTHNNHTPWADSASDKPRHNGLTAFGKDVVRELNRLGVMVDVSHVSDKTFEDVLAVSTAPVIASHSSCRALSDSKRNMTDDMLRALASNGGVVMINYAVAFLSEEFRAAPRPKVYFTRLELVGKKCGADQACRNIETERINHEAMRDGLVPMVGWEHIVSHIDHAVKVAGIDHVGLGSDFDGATMPLGMEDASKLPAITRALLELGYGEQDVAKILGGNLLRVMEEAEKRSW